MAFTQQTFLGASIVSFTNNLGLGGDQSSLTITLVEDPKNNDSFQSEILVGTPVRFVYDDFIFNGIYKSYRKKEGLDGFFHEITLEDPRELLSGVRLIMKDYAAATSATPNIYNVFGYWENQLFGSSLVNEGGIPWKKVRDAIHVISQGNTLYGTKAKLGNYEYKIDLTSLPSLPDYYRVPADSMSVLDYVQEVCDAASHDFYFTLQASTQDVPITYPPTIPPPLDDVLLNLNKLAIKLHTIDRSIQPQFGAIASFISNTQGAVSKNFGFDFKNEPTGKYLLGDKVSKLYYKSKNLNTENWEENEIWPFWGYKSDGSLVIGEGINEDHHMNLDARWVDVAGIGDTYETDLNELRTALDSFDAWAAYLWFNNYNYWKFVPVSGQYTDYMRDYNKVGGGTAYPGNPMPPKPWARLKRKNEKGNPTDGPTYKHEKQRNVHFGKGQRLEIPNVNAVFTPAITGLKGSVLSKSSLFDEDALQYSKSGKALTNAENVQKLYNYIKEFAEEYYGKKYIVKIDEIQSVFDTETGKIRTNYSPEQTGYIDEANESLAIENGLLPANNIKLRDTDYRLNCFVRYDLQTTTSSGTTETNILDLTNIPESDYVYDSGNRYAYIKSTIETDFGYVNYSSLSGVRAIVTLPSFISYSGIYTENHGTYFEFCKGFSSDVIADAESSAKEKTKETVGGVGGDTVSNLGMAKLTALPDRIVVPLRSNVERYGPWTSVGLNGKMEYEENDDLNPWNYNGYYLMNQVGQATVSLTNIGYNISEGGSVDFPGSPTIYAGQFLNNNGPLVNNVNCNTGDGGVRTTYNMSAWQPHPYKLRKAKLDQFSRVLTTNLNKRAKLLENIPASLKNSGPKTKPNKQKDKPVGAKLHSSHLIISADVYGSGEELGSNVAIQAHYNAANQIWGSGEPSLMSLDGLFRPFGTLPSAQLESGVTTKIPRYVEPSGGSFPTRTDLDPFDSSDIAAVLYNESGVAIANGQVNSNDIRALALRGPLVIAGWGYDVDGKPVPNASGDNSSSDFIANYKTRQDLWKVGPMDTRWDESRGVWVAGGGSTIKEGFLLQNLDGGIAGSGVNSSFTSTANMAVYSAGQPTGESILVTNRDINLSLFANQHVVVAQIGNEYRPLTHTCVSGAY